MKLTKCEVDAAKPGETDYFLHDEKLPGFCLRVYPSGKKSYLVQFRSRQNGRSRRKTIGPHGIFTPAEARKIARKLLMSIHDGEDPAEQRIEQRNELTIGELCDLYFADVESGKLKTKWGKPKSPKTIGTDRGRIERHIKPLLGTKHVKDLNRLDVETFLFEVERGKTKDDRRTGPRGRAIVRGGSGTARRTVGLLGAIITYAIKHGLRLDNPVHGIAKGKDRRSDRYLSSEEYGTLGQLLSDARNASHNDSAVDAIELLALTGCRRGEIEELEWREVDFERRCLVLENTKTGRSIRPIGLMAIQILKSLSNSASTDFVFPNDEGDAPYQGLPKVWPKMRRDTDLKDVTLHTLRHSFATVAAELGYSDITIAALLGHKLNTITSRYAHAVDYALLAAADRTSEEISSRLASAPPESGQVISFPQRLLETSSS